jgi:ATP-binding cassette subfamily B protein
MAAGEVDKTVTSADGLLLRVVRHGGGWTLVLLATTLTLAAVETAFPAVLGRAVDASLGSGDAAPWFIACGALVGVLLVADALDDVAAGTSTARATAWLRRSVLDHVLAVGRPRFDPGDLAARMTGNAADAGRAATRVIWALGAVLPALGGIVALAIIHPWLCLTFLVGTPVLLLIVRITLRDISTYAEEYLRVQGSIATRLTDAIVGARTIAAARSTECERRRILEPLPGLHRSGMGMWRVQSRTAAQQAVLLPLLEVAVLGVAGALLAQGRISPGGVLAASAYVAMASRLSSATTTVTQFARARAAAAREAEVLAEPVTVYGTAALPPGHGQVVFRGVTVREVLRRVDLVLPGGALVAVVGRSGSGKSVLAALAGRLAEPEAGEIVLDGVPLRELSREELRSAVAYGFERPALVGETIGGAITFGSGTGDVSTAARAARADEFIQRMPDGYGTHLADARMSGGEAQRVGLARAFAHGGRVLVLDDVAASLDTVTEHHIRAVLTGALSGRTRLVVAHRASTAAEADIVVWLDGGAVRATGPHRELWQDPAYRAVFG